MQQQQRLHLHMAQIKKINRFSGQSSAERQSADSPRFNSHQRETNGGNVRECATVEEEEEEEEEEEVAGVAAASLSSFGDFHWPIGAVLS